MSFTEYGKELVSLAVPFVAWLLNVGMKPKAKLIWTSPHAFTFLVQEPLRDQAGNIVQATQKVCTASVRVINSGREKANKVELVFNWRPQNLNLWPVRSYEEKSDGDGRHMLIFENLAPKEELGIEIMSVNQDLPGLIQVRSAECLAKNVQLMWFIKIPNWRIQLARLLVFIGLATSIYWAISLLQILILKTPLAN